MSFVHASAFTSLAETLGRSATISTSQQMFSNAAHPRTTSQTSGHTFHPYQFSARTTTAFPAEAHARLDPTLTTRDYNSVASHGYQVLDTRGYPLSGAPPSSTIGPEDVKKSPNSCPTPNGPMSKYPYNPLAIFPCGSGKTATRGDKISTLKSWLYEHRKNPYPTKGEKVMLAVITKMTLTQVSTWFANARRRLKKDSKVTLSAVVGCGQNDGDDDDDDDVDRNTGGGEVESSEKHVSPASHSVNCTRSEPTHLSSDTQTRKIVELNRSIIRANEDNDGDKNRGCKNELSEAASKTTYQNCPFVADSTKDCEFSASQKRAMLDSLSESTMPADLSVGEKRGVGHSPLKIKRDRSGHDLKHSASKWSSGKVSLSRDKQTSQVSSPEVSSSTCQRPKIWSVTDFINMSLPSTELSATSSLSTTTATTTASSWSSSISSASPWISNSLSPLITTEVSLPTAPLKSLSSQRHLPVSHKGVIHWPPPSSAFARLSSTYQSRTMPYPNTTGRLAVHVNGQEPAVVVEDKSRQTLYLQSMYPGFPSWVVFSSP